MVKARYRAEQYAATYNNIAKISDIPSVTNFSPNEEIYYYNIECVGKGNCDIQDIL